MRAIVGVMPSGVTHFSKLPMTPVAPRKISKIDEMMIAPLICDPFFSDKSEAESKKLTRGKKRKKKKRIKRRRNSSKSDTSSSSRREKRNHCEEKEND